MDRNNIQIILMIILGAIMLYGFFYDNRNQIKEAIKELGKAEKNLKIAIEQNNNSRQMIEELNTEIDRVNDSLEIIVAERDSIIYSYERWGSNSKYKIYNDKLREQSAILQNLKKNYKKTIASKIN
ncbi:MAG: hypothetical protein MI921_05760 [Cytophagales bacterium]|nr:hypothetical protein [Cytophagales bacterium]